jgi:glutamine amidotransferase
MDFLRLSCLDTLIKSHANLGGKIVGICLGMQMLLQTSSESPDVEGLGLIEGSCERIPASSSFSVPHIGWNALIFPESLHSCFLPFGKPLGFSMSDYYFVHSYYAKTKYSDSVLAAFAHPTGQLAAAVALDNVMGFQFHPEKSGSAGYALLDQLLAS